MCKARHGWLQGPYLFHVPSGALSGARGTRPIPSQVSTWGQGEGGRTHGAEGWLEQVFSPWLWGALGGDRPTLSGWRTVKRLCSGVSAHPRTAAGVSHDISRGARSGPCCAGCQSRPDGLQGQLSPSWMKLANAGLLAESETPVGTVTLSSAQMGTLMVAPM